MKAFILLILLKYTISLQYNGTATCKACTNLTGCAFNNCIYLTGGPNSNYEQACASVYGVSNCEITSAEFSVTQTCPNLSCQSQCCWQSPAIFSVRCVLAQYNETCRFTTSTPTPTPSDTTILSTGAIVGIAIGSAVLFVIIIILCIKCVICKTITEQQAKAQKQASQDQKPTHSAENIKVQEVLYKL